MIMTRSCVLGRSHRFSVHTSQVACAWRNYRATAALTSSSITINDISFSSCSMIQLTQAAYLSRNGFHGQ